ncbi:sugar nucleotide-binding protein [Candidatus Peregrinibacteria bacterium]|jgi:3,5-epimerase/4-reductase|nr:sugar nucleotide-binding protein [Candidatus Peregrinibacteria bacterium]MBT7344716.1 sugar nucleotide-binding protein [Candidatus Peregrinibacteria bacterium]
MKVLIFGSKGYLGQNFLNLYPDAIASSADISDPALVRGELETHNPDVVINAAGKTGRPNIDWCEENKEETIRANVTGPLIILDECRKKKIYWVQLSSGCIYAGDKGGEGFTEKDKPNFTGSFYSRSKAMIDQLLAEVPNVLILRLRMPFDGTDNPRSLISKLKNYSRILDVQNSITCLSDFMKTAEKLIEAKETGIFNVVNPGTMSPYEIMLQYKEIVDSSYECTRLTLEDLPDVVKAGRSNCVLSTDKIKNMGIQLQPVQEAIKASFEELAKNQN